MRADFVVRGVHVPTRFNTDAETRARMFREQWLWIRVRRVAAILAGDLNAKRPWRDGKHVQLLAAHSVDNIYGSDDWVVVKRVVVELKKRGLSDHDAVKVWLRHKETGELVTVATVNLKHHWKNPAWRAERIFRLLDADVVVCNEASAIQAAALRNPRGVRCYQARSNTLRGARSPKWTGNCIVWRTERVWATRRRQRPVFYIYLRGKKRSRRPRIPVPAVNWSPIAWFAFVPNKKEK